MPATPDVVDNRAEQRFEMNIDGQYAIAAYEVDGDVITFTHTAVPESLRGHGLATKLVEAALASARSHAQRVVPQCAMFAAYMKKHGDTHDLLAPGVSLA